MANSSYNGWSNYETASVFDWLDSDESVQSYWNRRARTLRAATNREDAIRLLASDLKSELEAEMPELSGMWAHLLNTAFGEVKFNEIATAMIGGAS